MQNRESIRRTILDYLEDDLGQKIEPFDDEVNIREGLGLDSVDVVGLVMEVERRFRVRLSSEELQAIVRVGDLLDLMMMKLATGDHVAA
jgi:acyl carrier protein